MELKKIEENYVDAAEEVILELRDKKRINPKNNKEYSVPVVTTSKMRNLLSMTADIYNEVINQNEDKLSQNINSRIEYLRVRFLYEVGRDSDSRDKSVKNFVETAKLIEFLKDIKGSKKKFILFNRYMEALVAFRKYYIKDDRDI